MGGRRAGRQEERGQEDRKDCGGAAEGREKLPPAFPGVARISAAACTRRRLFTLGVDRAGHGQVYDKPRYGRATEPGVAGGERTVLQHTTRGQMTGSKFRQKKEEGRKKGQAPPPLHLSPLHHHLCLYYFSAPPAGVWTSHTCHTTAFCASCCVPGSLRMYFTRLHTTARVLLTRSPFGSRIRLHSYVFRFRFCRTAARIS